MRQITRCGVLLAVGLAIIAGSARAADDKAAAAALDRKTVDGLMYTNLREVIDHGANLYNIGDWNGCYHLWEGALMGVKPLLAHRGGLQKTIDDSIASAQVEPMLSRRAFILRTSLDKVRADIVADYPELKKKKDTKPKVENPGSVDDPERNKPKDPPVVTPKPMKTLWDRLGGEAGVTKIVDDFFNTAVADPKVDFFRHGKFKPEADEIAKMKREMVEQFSQATGGPLKYNGPDMKKIHKDMGISGSQFDATVGHLKNALQKNKVADKDTATVIAAINSYRGEVVSTKKPEDKKPVDKKPEDKKPLDPKPEDKKPADKKPVDTKPVDKKPATKTNISGKVTFKGQPLPGGSILFAGKDGTVSAPITKDGGYTLAGVLKPGEYKIAIDTKPAPVPGEKIGAGANTPPDPKAAPKLVPIPAKYSNPKTSSLILTLVEGNQVHDINLQ